MPTPTVKFGRDVHSPVAKLADVCFRRPRDPMHVRVFKAPCPATDRGVPARGGAPRLCLRAEDGRRFLRERAGAGRGATAGMPQPRLPARADIHGLPGAADGPEPASAGS